MEILPFNARRIYDSFLPDEAAGIGSQNLQKRDDCGAKYSCAPTSLGPSVTPPRYVMEEFNLQLQKNVENSFFFIFHYLFFYILKSSCCVIKGRSNQENTILIKDHHEIKSITTNNRSKETKTEQIRDSKS